MVVILHILKVCICIKKEVIFVSEEDGIGMQLKGKIAN